MNLQINVYNVNIKSDEQGTRKESTNHFASPFSRKPIPVARYHSRKG